MLPDFIELSILNVLVSDIYLSCRKKEEEEGEREEEEEREGELKQTRIYSRAVWSEEEAKCTKKSGMNNATIP